MPDGSNDPTPSDEPVPEDPCKSSNPPPGPGPDPDPDAGQCGPPGGQPPVNGDDDETGGDGC